MAKRKRKTSRKVSPQAPEPSTAEQSFLVTLAHAILDPKSVRYTPKLEKKRPKEVALFTLPAEAQGLYALVKKLSDDLEKMNRQQGAKRISRLLKLRKKDPLANFTDKKEDRTTAQKLIQLMADADLVEQAFNTGVNRLLRKLPPGTLQRRDTFDVRENWVLVRIPYENAEDEIDQLIAEANARQGKPAAKT